MYQIIFGGVFLSDKKLLLKAVLFGTVCGLLVAVILTCIMSVFVMTCGLLPTELTSYIAVGLLSLGAFSGGIITSRITKSAGLVVGLITGFAIFLLITIMGMINSSDSVTLLTLLRFFAVILSGGAGGIVGLRRKERIHIK